jgi:hypothetical protein
MENLKQLIFTVGTGSMLIMMAIGGIALTQANAQPSDQMDVGKIMSTLKSAAESAGQNASGAGSLAALLVCPAEFQSLGDCQIWALGPGSPMG